MQKRYAQLLQFREENIMKAQEEEMKGKQIHIKHLNFGSFIKWNMFLALSFGIILGMIFFIFSLFGANPKANINNTEFTGLTAGIIEIFLVPFIFMILSIIFSIMSYLPLWIAMNIFKGIKLDGDFIVTAVAIEESLQNIEDLKENNQDNSVKHIQEGSNSA
jgi:hypothetical protein